jgi:hypothetical protein
LDDSVSRLRAVAQGFELAQALAARANVKRRLAATEPGEARRGAEQEAETDEGGAQELFARLGVVAATVW